MRGSSASPGVGLLADGGGVFPGENAWSSFGANVGDASLTVICRATAVTSSMQCYAWWEMQGLVDNFYILVSTVGIHFGPQAVACIPAGIRFPE